MVLVNKYPIYDNYLSKMLGFAQLYFGLGTWPIYKEVLMTLSALSSTRSEGVLFPHTVKKDHV